jgi:hypothetical protein
MEGLFLLSRHASLHKAYLLWLYLQNEKTEQTSLGYKA